MGTYVYKVTGKIVTDSEGRKANLLKYAYKLGYLNFDEQKAMFNTGCYRATGMSRTARTSPAASPWTQAATRLAGTTGPS